MKPKPGDLVEATKDVSNFLVKGKFYKLVYINDSAYRITCEDGLDRDGSTPSFFKNFKKRVRIRPLP